MKRIMMAVTALLITLTVSYAQNVVEGDNVEKRDVKSFHAVEASSGISVKLTKGAKEELAVTASDKEMLGKIKTEVSNGVLKITRENDNWKFWEKWKRWKITVYVSYAQLDAVRATSGSSISCSDINLSRLAAKMGSGGSIDLSGKVDALDVDGSSGAQFNGYGLTATNCKVDVSSGAGIHVTVTKEISAEASSGGFVRFKGDGLIRNINVSSGGSVKRL